MYLPSGRKLVRNLPLLSSFALFALMHVYAPEHILPAGAAVLAAAVLCLFVELPRERLRQQPVLPLLFACVLTLMLMSAYLLRSKDLEPVLRLSELLGISSRILALLLTLAGGWSICFVAWLMAGLYRRMEAQPSELAGEEAPLHQKGTLLASFFAAVVLIGICSQSSPLYPFNISQDANCFLTVGVGMRHGMVPYRDLLEQKGPLLYMLHWAAALISENSFLGVFPIEVLAAWGFLYLSHRILALYRPRVSLMWMLVIGLVVFTAGSFVEGDSAEEMCLPLVAYSVYCGLKAIRQKRLPSAVECFWVGVTSGCVLWIKFSLLGGYLGWFLAFGILAFQSRQLPRLLKGLGFIVLGVAVSSVPIILYFLVNDALTDLWMVYFYDNLFVYTVDSSGRGGILSLAINMLEGIRSVVEQSRLALYFGVLGCLGLCKAGRRRELLFVLLNWGGMFLLIYVGGRHYSYYSLILAALLPGMLVGLLFLEDVAQKHLPENKQLRTWAVRGICALCAAAAFVMSPNTGLLKFRKEDLPQFRFAEIMNQVENPTLLNYNFLDGGFYTVAGILPTCRVFCALNVPIEEVERLPRESLENASTEFVVVWEETLESENYTLVAEHELEFGSWMVYRLYQRVKEVQ